MGWWGVAGLTSRHSSIPNFLDAGILQVMSLNCGSKVSRWQRSADGGGEGEGASRPRLILLLNVDRRDCAAEKEIWFVTIQNLLQIYTLPHERCSYVNNIRTACLSLTETNSFFVWLPRKQLWPRAIVCIVCYQLLNLRPWLDLELLFA